MPTYFVATEAVAATLAKDGHSITTITPAKAAAVAADYASEFGPSKPASAITVAP